MNQVEERPRLGLMLYMTNVGQTRIKYPIKDKNTLKTSLIYGRSEIHKKEVQQIDKTLHFAINHLKKSDKINYVLNELINFNS